MDSHYIVISSLPEKHSLVFKNFIEGIFLCKVRVFDSVEKTEIFLKGIRPSLLLTSSNMKSHFSTENQTIQNFAEVDFDFFSTNIDPYLTLKLKIDSWLTKFNIKFNKSFEKVDDHEFYPVDLRLLIGRKSVPYECFIKVGPLNFVSVLKTINSDNHMELLNYYQKGVQSFYLLKDNYISLLDTLFKDCIDENASLNINEKTILKMLYVKETLLSVGINTDKMEIIAKTAQDYIEELFSKKKFKDLFFDLVKNKTKNYFLDHSLFTMYLACYVYSELSPLTKGVVKSFVYSAFLHDIFVQDEHLCQVKNFTDQKFLTLSESNKELLRKHIPRAVELLRQMDLSEVDAIKIISDHHERPRGDGYPRGINSKYLGQLTSIFIVCHDVATKLFHAKKIDRDTMINILQDFESEFSVDNFILPFDILRNNTH